ncbi:hypothetical protein VSR34_37945, partial [Paraburkholderia sp. JHI2823]|uniref:hypothetical protein n=1 Tax=Paraburkholderia sp. JHI2823 TaxID=3112960 RepID=UPI00317BD3D4
PHSALKRLIRVEIAQCERFSGSGRVNRGRPLPVEGYFRNLLSRDRSIEPTEGKTRMESRMKTFRLMLAVVIAGAVPALSSAAGSQANLASDCDGTETFVFVPPGVDRQKYLSEYVKTHKGPSDDELRRCNLSRDQWRAQVLKSH